MSRNALILEKAASRTPAPPQSRTAPHRGDYTELIRRLRDHSTLAVINAGSGSRSDAACTGIARELNASGKRVVIVHLTGTDRMPGVTTYVPGESPNVSLWPNAPDGSVEFFQRSITPALESEWLSELRPKFDAVLLDCSRAERAHAAQFAAKADVAVLVVEAGRITKEQIQREQRGLHLAGVNLAGCILMQQR
jgi:hypothetical protein